ncbi:MAG TPA: acyltransferase [Tepidisphaeraceae bacterium]|nr:acyltransferase [Tepidisphaeraceae bacterium]
MPLTSAQPRESTHPEDAASTAHVPALDGLRGLAIFLVLLTHFMQMRPQTPLDQLVAATCRFGWVGVDLFFVLSGFLITQILLDNKNQTNYFRNFYARRILRIFPAYYALLVFTFVIVPHSYIGHDENFRPVPSSHVPLYWLYLSNFPLVFTSDLSNNMLAVTWSLAIEEQFYLIWPLVVWLFAPAALQRICFALIFIALIVRTMLTQMSGVSQMTIYMLTPCRMDALAVGAILAMIIHQRGVAGARALAPAAKGIALISGISLIYVAVHSQNLFFADSPQHTIFYSVIAIFFGCVLLTVRTSPSGSMTSWLFTRRWLRFLGRYSYAIYLVHLPVRTIVRDFVYPQDRFASAFGSALPGQFIFFVLCASLSILLALMSWHLLEKHFLRLKRYFPVRHMADESSVVSN